MGGTPQRALRDSPMVIDTPIPSPGLGSFAGMSLRGSPTPSTPYPPSNRGSSAVTVDLTHCPDPRTRSGSNTSRTPHKEDPRLSSPDQLPTSKKASSTRSSSITPTPKTNPKKKGFDMKTAEKKMKENIKAKLELRKLSDNSQVSRDLGITSLESRSPPPPPTSQPQSSPSLSPTSPPRSARRRSRAQRSYPHENSPHRHLSPTHQPGWAGWEALERQAQLAVEAAAAEKRGRDRESRYQRRQEGRD